MNGFARRFFLTQTRKWPIMVLNFHVAVWILWYIFREHAGFLQYCTEALFKLMDMVVQQNGRYSV